jgi:hypothetical protein
MDKEITLILTPLRFYTQTDEALMFKWLKKVKSIKSMEGMGRELHVHISSKQIPDSDLLELFGIFERYNFDLSQLTIFKNEANKNIFEV